MTDEATTYPEWADLMTQSWAANVKAMFEQHLRDGEREREQKNDWHTFALQEAERHAQIVNRLAQDHASLSSRMGNNASTIDHLANVGALSQITEFRSIGAQVAQEAAEAATAAINAALAQGATTSAAAQGTAGVAQGSLQAGIAGAIVNQTQVLAAIGGQLAEMQRALGVLLVKATGEESGEV